MASLAANLFVEWRKELPELEADGENFLDFFSIFAEYVLEELIHVNSSSSLAPNVRKSVNFPMISRGIKGDVELKWLNSNFYNANNVLSLIVSNENY